MRELTFTDELIEAIRKKRSILCVGLDPQLRFMPPHLIGEVIEHYGLGLEAMAQLFLRFNIAVIEAVSPFTVVVKPQMAFYEAYGHWAIEAYEKIINFAHLKGLLVITDAKRGDGGETATAYANGYLGRVPFWGSVELPREVKETVQRLAHPESVVSPVRTDALTIHAWIGSSCVSPFVEAAKESGTGVFVVDKTSFTPNSEIEQIVAQSGRPNWQELASLVAKWGEGTEGKYGYRNLGVVMGATYPDDAVMMREILPNAWFLIPGYGRQGGGADGAVVGVNKDGLGGIVNSSRGIIAAWQKGQFQTEPEKFAEAAAGAAEFARNDLNAALERAGKVPW